MTPPTLWARFTHRLVGFAVVETDWLEPVVEVLAYDDGMALVVGRGKCALWFPLDQLVVRPGSHLT